MIVELRQGIFSLWQEFLESFINVIDEKKLKEEFINNPYVHYLLFKKDNKIVAFLNYSEIYDRIEINQIEVLDKYQRQGIASKLLQEVVNIATNNKCINITLEVRCDNVKAINLYEKFGFKKRAKRSSYYNGVDGILMEKEMI